MVNFSNNVEIYLKFWKSFQQLRNGEKIPIKFWKFQKEYVNQAEREKFSVKSKLYKSLSSS